MARREASIARTAGEKRIWANEKSVGPLAHEGCESRIDLTVVLALRDLDLELDGAAAMLSAFVKHASVIVALAGLTSKVYTSCLGHGFAQQFQSLCHQLP